MIRAQTFRFRFYSRFLSVTFTVFARSTDIAVVCCFEQMGISFGASAALTVMPEKLQENHSLNGKHLKIASLDVKFVFYLKTLKNHIAYDY